MKKTLFALVLLVVAAGLAVAQTAGNTPSGTTSSDTAMPGGTAAGQAHTANPPASQTVDQDSHRKKGKGMVDEATLNRQVQDQLNTNAEMKNVQATVSNCVVDLSGSVPNKRDRKQAKKLVASVPGVCKIHEHLNVNANAGGEPNNEPANARVTGTTAQKETASNTAGSIAGNSQAATTAAMGTSQIQQNIQQQIINSNVQVSQTANNIVLAGTVPTDSDKQRAEQIARQNSGGMTVVNNLQVSAAPSTAAGAASSPQSPAAGSSTASGGSTSPQAGTAANEAAATGQTGTSSTGTASGQAGASASGNTGSVGQASAAGGSLSSDTALQSQIQNALQSDPTLANDHLNANVTPDTIELSGSVQTGKERQTALRIVQSYAGNRRVVDKLTVAGRGQGANTGGAMENNRSQSTSGPTNTESKGESPSTTTPSSPTQPSNPNSTPQETNPQTSPR